MYNVEFKIKTIESIHAFENQMFFHLFMKILFFITRNTIFLQTK